MQAGRQAATKLAAATTDDDDYAALFKESHCDVN